jgi:sarcosine oxidase
VDYDVIIAGLGAMGSAAAFHLAARGLRVLGIDRFRPPHAFGSSHGATRIIREAYFEHPAYVPLVQRAYELWRELEIASGRKLLLETGGLMIGPAAGALVRGALRSAEEHRLPHQLLVARQVREQFPALLVSDSDVAVHEPRAGILYPERAVQTHLDLAARKGAELQFEDQILKWEPFRGGVRVNTLKGIFVGKKLLLTLGPWLGALTPGLNLPLRVERQVLFWFDAKDRPELFAPEHFPIFIWENEPGQYFYGFPDLGDGIKIAVHHQGETTPPDEVRREVSPIEIEQAAGLLHQHLPAAAGRLRSSTVCLYTNTPDEHFLLDHYPACPQTLIASPCSGHGFKFSPVIGELAAAMLCGETPRFDLNLFRLPRLLRSPGAPRFP